MSDLSSSSHRDGLMVVADDYAMCEERTNAILQLHSATGVLSRTSMLVNGNDAARAAVLAKQHSIQLGLHFNITEGPPVAQPSSSASFALWSRTTGHFAGKAHVLQRLSMAESEGGQMMREDAKRTVRDELTAQLDLFVHLTGVHDVWLDGHHHVHHVPLVAEVILEVFEAEEQRAQREHEAPRWTLRGLRIAHDPSLPLLPSGESPLFTSDEVCFGMPFWVRVSALAKQLYPRVPTHVTATDCFLGFDVGGSDCSAVSLEAKLQAIAHTAPVHEGRTFQPKGRKGFRKITELMIHPGTFDTAPVGGEGAAPQPPFVDFSSEWREHELQFYLSNGFRELMHRMQLSIY